MFNAWTFAVATGAYPKIFISAVTIIPGLLALVLGLTGTSLGYVV